MKKIKKELTEDQKKALSYLSECVSPGRVRWLRFENPDESYMFSIDQDSLPVIRAYLDLIEEAIKL